MKIRSTKQLTADVKRFYECIDRATIGAHTVELRRNTQTCEPRLEYRRHAILLDGRYNSGYSYDTPAYKAFSELVDHLYEQEAETEAQPA